MSGGIDPRQFAELAEEWTQMDLAIYAETFRQLNEHDAEDLLDEIETPTLVIGTHFAGPTAGRLVRDGDAYRLQA